MGQFKHHVFVCTSGSTCPGQGGDAVFAALKKGAKDAGLKGTVRVNHSGCLGQCGHGPMAVVYPDDVWYAGLDVHGAERILRDHLLGGKVVESYRYIAPPGENKIED
jgi:(2Fe-2S) ferredoxin